MKSQAQSKTGVANQSAATDLEKDQTLYNLEYKENISKLLEAEVYFGGHNLYRVYESDGERSSVLTIDDMNGLVEDFLTAIADSNFRAMFGDTE